MTHDGQIRPDSGATNAMNNEPDRFEDEDNRDDVSNGESESELSGESESGEEENIRLGGGDAIFFGKTIRFPESAIRPVSDRTSPEADFASDEADSPDADGDNGSDSRPFLSFFEESSAGDDREDKTFRRRFESFFQSEGDESDDFSDDADDDGRQTEEEDNAEDGAEDGDDSGESETLSFDEMVQREESEAAEENLEALIRQNDADLLFTLGEKYERGEEDADLGAAAGQEIEINPTTILEAMLFVGNRENRPLSIAKAASLMRNVSEEDALQSVAELNRRYDASGAPYKIVRTDDGLTMVLRPELESVRERFFNKAKGVKLSQKAIDILALIAYHQPVSPAEIQNIRPQSGAILSLLLKRGLIAQEKRMVEKESVNYYRTTPRLLKLLGVDSLDDLPIVEEVDYR